MAEPMPAEEIARHTQILDTSHDSETLTASAVALASSEDPAAILAVGRRLKEREFLARLDDLSDPSSSVEHFAQVFRALAEHPTRETGRLCELLYGEPGFRDPSFRTNFLLAALAAVRPTTPGGAEVFRSSSAEGYAEVNGPLLIKNQSPLALQVFEEIIAADWLEVDPKVSILHRAVVPYRTSAPVLQVCARLLDRPLAAEVRTALIESLFDYRTREWYGPVLSPPAPPPSETANDDALKIALELADRAAAMQLDSRLREAVRSSREQIERIRRTRAR